MWTGSFWLFQNPHQCAWKCKSYFFIRLLLIGIFIDHINRCICRNKFKNEKKNKEKWAKRSNDLCGKRLLYQNTELIEIDALNLLNLFAVQSTGAPSILHGELIYTFLTFNVPTVKFNSIFQFVVYETTMRQRYDTQVRTHVDYKGGSSTIFRWHNFANTSINKKSM